MTVDLQGVTELSPSILFLRGFILEHIRSQLAKKNKRDEKEKRNLSQCRCYIQANQTEK